MTMFSTRVLTASKVALSMAISYWIALSMAWDNPHWAAFSVAFCSLATVGESLLKGLLRTFGTFCAIFAALLLLSLFPQDRWIFSACVSAWVVFCTWKMYENPNWYFWFCAGLGVPLMSIMSGGESLQAFQTVVLRAQETILGTLVFTVVSSLIFPTNTRGSFENDVELQLKDLNSVTSHVMEALRLQSGGSDRLHLPPDLLKQSALRQIGLMTKLEAAALDSFDIAETKRAWRKAVVAIGGAVDTLERLRLGLPDLQGANPIAHIVGIEATLEVIFHRFRAVQKDHESPPTNSHPKPIRLHIDEEVADALPAFQRAALTQTMARIKELDKHTERLLLALADVYGYSNVAQASEVPMQQTIWLPDPERVFGTLRVFAAFWMTILAYFFVPDLPSPVLLIVMTTAITMLMITAPTLPLWGLARPVLISVLFGGVIHIIVMPQLANFAELGLVIFATTFAICWLCYKPQHAMGRALGLAFFATLAQVDNAQTYSFTFVANLIVAFGFVMAVLVVVSYFPVSFRPERVFLRMIRRYFVALVVLLETLHLDKRSGKSWLESQRRSYHERQIKILPTRMSAWIRALPKDAITEDERKALTELVASMAMLNDRTRDLLSTRKIKHSEDRIASLVEEARAWRHAIQSVCTKLGVAETSDLSVDDLNLRLSTRMATLERLVADTLSENNATQATEVQNSALFNELGGFRGVSDTLISLVKLAKKIEWTKLQEARV